MSNRKALLASLGTSALLVGCFIAMLGVVGAVVAFNGFPGASTLQSAPRTIVVSTSNKDVGEVQLTDEDLEAAEAADAPPPDPDPAPAVTVADLGTQGGGSPAPTASPGSDGGGGGDRDDGGRTDPVPPDPPQEERDDGLEDVPRVLDETGRGLDLGRAGRSVTGILSDGVVGKLDPGSGDTVKNVTEPVWELLDRD